MCVYCYCLLGVCSLLRFGRCSFVVVLVDGCRLMFFSFLFVCCVCLLILFVLFLTCFQMFVVCCCSANTCGV